MSMIQDQSGRKPRIHFMGIGGSGISGVAMIAHKMGYRVTGCDLEGSTAYLKNVVKGHSPSHVKMADLTVASPAIFYQNSKHPEFKLAKKLGKLITWQEFLGKILHTGKIVICVAGTHGKSTTTAMVGKLLTDVGFDPSVMVGANVRKWGGNARYGRGKYFVTEADEFFNNFLNYSPEIIILNNIEYDHPDFFKSEKDVYKSFEKFIEKLTGKKLLIVNGEDSGIKKVLSNIDLKDINLFKYMPSEGLKSGLKLKIFGKHNLSNALGVLRLGQSLGIDEKQIKKSLEEFEGVGRRMELVYSGFEKTPSVSSGMNLPAGKAGRTRYVMLKKDRNPDHKVVGAFHNKKNIRIYDDYAHHPTAIATTLSGLRSEFPNKRIWAIVEPHGFNRTYTLLNLYKNVFKDADKVIIGPIFKARDKRTFEVSPKKVCVVSGHKDIMGANSFGKIKKIIQSEIKSGDIILVMGAGKSYLWAKSLSESF